MLLKTHVEKMSVLATPTIFMKTRDLSRNSHDIHENKGSYAPGSTALNALEGSTPGAEVNHVAANFPAEYEKKMLNNTFKAGMYMKTKDRKTECPNRNRLIVSRFRHFRRIECHFAENCCLSTTICRVHSVSYRFYRAWNDPSAKDGRPHAHRHKRVLLWVAQALLPVLSGHSQEWPVALCRRDRTDCVGTGRPHEADFQSTPEVSCALRCGGEKAVLIPTPPRFPPDGWRLLRCAFS